MLFIYLNGVIWPTPECQNVTCNNELPGIWWDYILYTLLHTYLIVQVKKKKFHLFLRIFHLHNSNKNYDERNGNLRTIVLGWASFCRHAVLCCSSLEWWNYFHHNLLGRRGSLTEQIDVTGVYYEGWKLWMTVDWDLAHHDFTKWDLGNLKMAFTLGNWGHSKQRLAKRWLAKLL